MLTELKTFDKNGNLNAVIETSRGGRTKLAFDQKLDAFTAKKVLPQGMSFPFDFGFIPSTLGDDDDPIDVLVLMDEALPTGTVVPSRLIGVIEAEQTDKDGETTENSRLIAVAAGCQIFSDVKKLSDLLSSRRDDADRSAPASTSSAGCGVTAARGAHPER